MRHDGSNNLDNNFTTVMGTKNQCQSLWYIYLSLSCFCSRPFLDVQIVSPTKSTPKKKRLMSVKIKSGPVLLALWIYVRMDPLPPSPVISEKISDLNLGKQQGKQWNLIKRKSSTYLSTRSAWYSRDRERRVEPSMWRRLKRIGPRFTESTILPESNY